MSGKYLFDTNAVISLLRGDVALLSMAENAETVYISIITVIEFLSFSNMSEEDEKLFEEFCRRVETIDLLYDDKFLIREIISIRKTYMIKIPDAIICASSKWLGAELVTADQQLLSVWSKVSKPGDIKDRHS